MELACLAIFWATISKGLAIHPLGMIFTKKFFFTDFHSNIKNVVHKLVDLADILKYLK